jgi:hypothetical protein
MIACTALGGRILSGRVAKDGWSFVGSPKDVTSECLKAVIEKVGVGKVDTVAVGGVPTYEIEVRLIAPLPQEQSC